MKKEEDFRDITESPKSNIVLIWSAPERDSLFLILKSNWIMNIIKIIGQKMLGDIIKNADNTNLTTRI
ncbi:hypothetical protein CLA01_39920 [Chryseobacterium lathyri]|uniref:Uncharacterized protein n=1 Tax=Chryseobacterium lathyri TaxID=395933 RepID=A0A511YFE0_9FLAO|nr:hypothetical protein CLA01_39920 [Chryseobacterium lathyri]